MFFNSTRIIPNFKTTKYADKKGPSFKITRKECSMAVSQPYHKNT